MIRRVNSTGRKLIDSHHAQFTITLDGHGLSHFSVKMDLKDLNLDRDCPVFVEALRRTSFCRYPYGVVGMPRQSICSLPREMGAGQGVRFRIKVVESVPWKKGRPPCLAAVGESFTPRLPDPAKGKSLLPVDWGDFRDQVWMLSIDEQGGPVLLVSRHLVKDYEELVRSQEFLTLAMPSVFRQLLSHIVMVQKENSSEDHPGWIGPWLRLAGSWNGQGDPPDPDENPDLADEWIENAVGAFAHRTKIGRVFENWWNAGGQR